MESTGNYEIDDKSSDMDSSLENENGDDYSGIKLFRFVRRDSYDFKDFSCLGIGNLDE